jgi:fructokinase
LTAERYGGIEAGGTKWVCAVADASGAIVARDAFPTAGPSETLDRAAAFFAAQPATRAVGIGCFGPIDPRPGSDTYGWITTTPKPGWADVDVVGPLRAALGVPIAFDTDVNAAALGEWRRGAAQGLGSVVYMTVGTGIGAGAIVDGRIVHGLLHPEVGHMRVPHDRGRDPFAGSCPRHGDCLEGLASGEALRRRWGVPAERLDDPEAWALEAEYLALALVNVTCVLSPQRVIVGGGVGARAGLLGQVRRRLLELLAGYLPVAELTDHDAVERYVAAPGLGDDAGVTGAIELALAAAPSAANPPT